MNVVSAGVAWSLQTQYVTHTVLHNRDGVSVRKRIAGAVVPDPDRCNQHHHTSSSCHSSPPPTLLRCLHSKLTVAVDHTTILTVYNIDL